MTHQWRQPSRYLYAALSLISISTLFAISSAQAQNLPPPLPSCDARAFHGLAPDNGPTGWFSLDLVTGDLEELRPALGTNGDIRFNGFGYSMVDDRIYGPELPVGGGPATGRIIVVGGDHVGQRLAVVPGLAGNAGVTGEVSPDGLLYNTSPGAGNATVYVVDVDPASPDFLTIARTFQRQDSSGTNGGLGIGPDWVYHPGDDQLYSVRANNDLVRIDPVNGEITLLGNLNLPDTGGMGGMFLDASGFLYGYRNANGNIYRIDIGAVTATLFTTGLGNIGNNDGARCPAAPILIDFGDAPDEDYGTLLTAAGARHGLPIYNENTNTAPLMLGAQVDPEDDGMPGPDAADDDFDDGVTDPIQFLAGEPTTVTVSVTNDSDEDATLAGWIDLDGTGTFDAGDRAPLETIPANSGTQDYMLTFPPGTTAADTYARFRVFPGMVDDPPPTGPASAGEVEDYLVLVGRVQYVKTITPDDVTELQPGDVFAYTITVSNAGSVPLTGLNFSDDLSQVLDDATFVVGSLTFDLGVAVFDPIAETIEWELDPDMLEVGETATISFEVEIDDPVPGDGVLLNSVLGDGPGSNCVDDPATEPDCFKEVPQPQLAVTKTSNAVDPVEPGDMIEYTFTITNVGPGPANNAVVYDDLSGVLDDAGYNGDAAIVPAGQGQVIFEDADERLRWNGPLGAAGDLDDSVTITYSVTVNAADQMGDGTLQNALITPSCPNPPIFDPDDPGFDEDCVEITGIEAWIVEKTSDPAGNVEPGDTVSYTVEVINTGGVDLTGLSFTDDLSGVLDDAVFDTGSESADIGAAIFDPVTETLEWSSVPDTLVVDQTATVSYSVTVNDANGLGDGVLGNAITGTPNCPDPGASDACGTINPVEAWSAVKTSDTPGPVEPGDTINYELTITNLGGADLVGGDGAALEVNDDLSGVLDDAIYNGDEFATLGEVSYTEPVLTWSGDLLVGETAVVTYSVTVNDAADLGDGTLTNAVTGSPNCPDPAITDPGDPGFDPDCVSNVPTGPQLSVEKAIIAESMMLDGIAEPGEELTYSIRVRNDGGTDAADVEVNEIVPDNTTYVAAGSDAWSCADGSGPGTACDFVIATVPAQGFIDLLYRVRVDDPIPPGVTAIANAVALDGEDPPECPPADDPACAVIPTEPQTVISKSLTGESIGQNGQAEAGEVLTYTLTLQNHGGSDDLNVVVNELVPDHTVTAAGNQSVNGALGDWSCADGSAPGTACDFVLPTIAAGQTIMLEFMVQVDDPIPDGVTEVANAVALNGEDPPPCPPSSPQCVITPTEPAVSVIKTLFMEDGEVDGRAEPGETLVYELVVTNSGGSTAFDEFLRDIVPQYTTFVGDPASSPGWTCADGSVNPTVCDLFFDIGAGETLNFLFALEVDDPLPDGVTQIANAIGLGGNPPPCPPAGVHCVVVPTVPEVTIAKALTGESGSIPGMAEPGEQLTYTITLSNAGGADATDFGVTDQLDPNVIFVSADNGGALVGDTVEWTGLTVPAGGDLELTVVVEVVDPIPDDVSDVSNVAFDPSEGPPDCGDDPAPPNCTTTPTVPVVAISKALTGENGSTPGVAEPGEELTYTITLTNFGGADATDFGVIDQPDANVIFVSADNGGVHDGSTTGGQIQWTGLTVPGSGSLELTVVVQVVDPVPGGVTVIGNVAYDPAVGVPDCDTDPVPPNCTTIDPPEDPLAVPLDAVWMLWLLGLLLLLAGMKGLPARRRI